MVSLIDHNAELSKKELASTYQMRINSGNVVYNYNTSISFVCHDPITYLHLSLPNANQRLSERKSPRISTKKRALKLSISNGKALMNASMADISLEGAKLISRQRLAKVDEIFYIDLQTEQDAPTITLPCKVRYVRTDIQTEGQDSIVFHHGVEFSELSVFAEQFIASFVHTTSH